MQNGEILSNTPLKSGYFMVRFHAPDIAAKARPGQFVHVRVSTDGMPLLRRPFSIHSADDDVLSIAYKVVGTGTEKLSRLKAGDCCDLLGPLGRPFTPPGKDEIPVLVAGGYGSAALYLLTRLSSRKGLALLGARSEEDIILADRYADAGFDVRISTDDGSAGKRGRVTELIPPILEEFPASSLRFYGCGPRPMLLALASLLNNGKLAGEVSLDHLMCCGVGACFSCVVKVRDESGSGFRYARACKDGPVFDAGDVWPEP